MNADTLTTTHLDLSWSTSRGRDTYGYNICRLEDTNTGKRYRCTGGGYDMQGTVLAEWLQDVYQIELQAIGGQAGYMGPNYNPNGLSGMTWFPDGTVRLDGACGISSIERIARALGLSIKWLTSRKGTTLGFIVSPRTTA